MVHRRVVSMALLFVLGLAADAWAGWRVWTVTETRRVLREDPAAEGLAVALRPQNQWASFQILLRSDARCPAWTSWQPELGRAGRAVMPKARTSGCIASTRCS